VVRENGLFWSLGLEKYVVCSKNYSVTNNMGYILLIKFSRPDNKITTVSVQFLDNLIEVYGAGNLYFQRNQKTYTLKNGGFNHSPFIL